MNHLETSQISESFVKLTAEQIVFLDEYTRGTWELNSEGLVDVRGNFNCPGQGLTDFKGIRFGRVSEDFNCSDNELTTLKGAPREIVWYFYSYNNKLTTLEGAPQSVGGSFYCHRNKLTTLEGAPQTIGDEFYSDFVKVPEGQWSLQTLIEMYRGSSRQEKELLGTLVSPEALQKAIDANPERATIDYKSIVHLPEYKGLKWPESLKAEVDLLSDLDSVGL